ncbi:hypothetical protein, partial [Rhizobium favelukesii]|uniref:hypothetical protein n=1 Tax=Rhizobium favelukesii TaxID=348824 RepID=UPI00055E10DA
MTEFKSVLDATSQLVSQILNLVGLVEKNQASFENLQNRYQKKRSKRVLEELLMQLVGHRTMNRMALIPTCIDQNRCAHSRSPMDIIFQGCATS